MLLEFKHVTFYCERNLNYFFKKLFSTRIEFVTLYKRYLIAFLKFSYIFISGFSYF